MVCLGLKPGVAGWKAQMNPLSYGSRNAYIKIFSGTDLRSTRRYKNVFQQMQYVSRRCRKSLFLRKEFKVSE